MSETVFCQEALEANRRGTLSAGQLNELQAQVARKHTGIMGQVGRRLDRWANDVQAGQVEVAEGAVTKRTRLQYLSVENENTPTVYEIRVANRQAGNQIFDSPQDIYDAAPGLGMIRLFYLPHSRRVVNFERLPDPVVTDTSAQGAAQTLLEWGKASLKLDQVGAAEARARLAAIGGDVARYLPDQAPASFVPSEAGTVAAAIVGEWKSPMLSVSFAPDGGLTAQVAGEKPRAGTWSMDADGRLHSDVMGAPIAADASIVGDELTLVINGQALTLQRVPATI